MRTKEKMYRIIEETHICETKDYVIQKYLGISHLICAGSRYVTLYKRYETFEAAKMAIDKYYAQDKIDFGNKVSKERKVWPTKEDKQ